MLKDGLWDVYNDFGMGVCAEICADQYTITREEQDSYAIRSFERGSAAQNSGLFSWEIALVEVSSGRGKPSIIVNNDEGLEKFDAAKLRKLRPSFKDGGTVTAGNASIISDGAAALVLVSGAKALELGLQVIAKIRGFADAAQVLRHKNGKYGVGGICKGGGGASALVLEFMQAVLVIRSSLRIDLYSTTSLCWPNVSAGFSIVYLNKKKESVSTLPKI